MYNSSILENAKIAANEFKDPTVGHYGKSNPWPKFEEKKVSTIKDFKLLVKDELKCYHSRISIEENPLGLLVNITRNFRTGKIQDVSVSKEIVCLKSFINESLRYDIDNVKYS